jgi:LytS/YehU family sensor histidine kinase
MKTTIIKWSIGIALGAVGGFLYWYYIGCNSGSCAITFSPINSTLYGGMMGGLLLNSFEPKKRKDETPKTPDQ